MTTGACYNLSVILVFALQNNILSCTSRAEDNDVQVSLFKGFREHATVSLIMFFIFFLNGFVV